MESGKSNLPYSGPHSLSWLLSPSPAPWGPFWALSAGCSCLLCLGDPQTQVWSDLPALSSPVIPQCGILTFGSASLGTDHARSPSPASSGSVPAVAPTCSRHSSSQTTISILFTQTKRAPAGTNEPRHGKG